MVLSGGQVIAAKGDPTAMVHDFIHDLNLAKEIGILPDKYNKPHKVWAIFQHAEQKGIPIQYKKNGDKNWDAIVDNIDKLKVDAKPNTEGATLNMANKFAVDTFAATINHYVVTIPEAERSANKLKALLKKIAAFTKMSSISTNSWIAFTKKQEGFEAFLNNLTVDNSIYDNPGKLTRSRLIACAGCLFPS